MIDAYIVVTRTDTGVTGTLPLTLSRAVEWLKYSANLCANQVGVQPVFEGDGETTVAKVAGTEYSIRTAY